MSAGCSASSRPEQANRANRLAAKIGWFANEKSSLLNAANIVPATGWRAQLFSGLPIAVFKQVEVYGTRLPLTVTKTDARFR